MARPPKLGLDYFPHDTDAVSDEKVEALMGLHGCDGYAVFFVLLERIYRTENGVLPMGKLTDKVGIARKLSMEIDRFDSILSSALEIGCFDAEAFNNDKVLTSNGIRKRISRVMEIRLKERTKKEEYKNKKEKEKEKEKETYPRKTPLIPTGKLQLYANFWELYPSREGKKIGKNEAEKRFNQLTPEEQNQTLIAVKNYASSTKFPVDPVRFFKSREYPNGLWREWVNPEIQTSNKALDAAGRELKVICPR